MVVMINEFCIVFQIQCMYECDVCGGNKWYYEIVYSYFGVVLDDVWFNWFEFLFGGLIKFIVNFVV